VIWSLGVAERDTQPHIFIVSLGEKRIKINGQEEDKQKKNERKKRQVQNRPPESHSFSAEDQYVELCVGDKTSKQREEFQQDTGNF